MAPRPFKPLDVEDVISKLSLNEKTRLLAGIDNVSGSPTLDSVTEAASM